MYVTRPLSLYRQFPNILSLPPPEGPNSGYLVIQDEDSVDTYCFGLYRDPVIRDLPFPQDKILSVSTTEEEAYFIPVPNQPLSSHRYYVIKAHGKRKGESRTSSRKEDMGSCFCSFIKPRAFDHQDMMYQQVEIIRLDTSCCRGSSGFVAKSVMPEASPPKFLRTEGWQVTASTPRHYRLGEAQGLDFSLQQRLPEFDFPLSEKSPGTVVIGKWYCPFMFVKEEGRLKDQMKRSIFYEMTLEQQWEQIYTCENNLGQSNSVVVNVFVESELALIWGKEPAQHDTDVVDGVMWFRTVEGEESVGLSLSIMERMKWEQERVGWTSGSNRQVRGVWRGEWWMEQVWLLYSGREICIEKIGWKLVAHL